MQTDLPDVQGVAGVGGLLRQHVFAASTISYRHLYDAIGNITQLSDNSGGISAAYEYDAFGKLKRMSGTFAPENFYRYSTKYHDDETGLSSYGFRYFSAKLGRWMSRDPIQEAGGLNIMAFVNNQSLNVVDLLGLADFTKATCRAACKDIYGRRSAACEQICKILHGTTCVQLLNLCKHMGRHGKKKPCEMCLMLYNTLC